jgi:transcriptional regulator with PAS, ATPase and Fis domain
VSCAAVPENLLEAELFGYERGAFTGADRPKPGLLEAADGGTFFLDEIGELPSSMQAKLLRVLERREVQRLGALAPKRVDVRFIAATHRDLSALAQQGRFRSDLLYRLNGITLVIPPLRERMFQLPELAHAFAATAAAAAELGRAAPPISAEAIGMLERHAWPGNIRELKNTIERAVLLSEGGPIGAEHIELEIGSAARPPSGALGRHALRQDYADFERERISAALDQAGGNQTEAAKRLGISRRTLMNRLDALGLPRPRKRPR